MTPWTPPAPYGHPESVQAAGTVAAPLLAGFTITLIGLVVDTSNDGVRHRDTALLVLTAAVACLLVAIQCAYSARRYMVLPDELTSWWPDLLKSSDDPGEQKLRDETVEEVRAEQRAHHLLNARWARRFRTSYHVGIILMLAGLGVLLIPPGSITTVRMLAIGLAGFAAVGEAIWILATMLNDPEREDGRLRRVVTIAQRMVPSYDERLRDARLALAARGLVAVIANAKLDANVTVNLIGFLVRAADELEAGAHRDARMSLRCFALLASFQTPQFVDTRDATAWARTVRDILKRIG